MNYLYLCTLYVLLLFKPDISAGRPLNMDRSTSTFPLPFTRPLWLQEPQLKGDDVTILQGLLVRSPFVKYLKISGTFDNETRQSLCAYQRNSHLKITGELDVESAMSILANLMYDGYKDDGTVPTGFKFKLYIPVYKNRSIETTAKLIDSKNQVVHSFTVRTHGYDELNQLTTNGNTPTGLATCDLNSPEPNTKSFGPYDVLRQVKGLKGNVAIAPNDDKTFIPYIRYGILMHTGEWQNWTPSQPMPNSNGCIHAHPADQKKVVDILKSLGVKVRKNPFEEIPYPEKPQGLLSIEQID